MEEQNEPKEKKPSQNTKVCVFRFQFFIMKPQECAGNDCKKKSREEDNKETPGWPGRVFQ